MDASAQTAPGDKAGVTAIIPPSMDFYDVWNDAIEEIKKRVSGVATWNALNLAVPVTFEDGIFVLGFKSQDVALMGHLRMAGTQRVIEQELEKRLGQRVRLQLLEGITINDWLAYKRRRAEAERIEKETAERDARRMMSYQSWEEVFEALSREYGSLGGKGMPQAKARLLEKCVQICVEAVLERSMDEADERNLARCIDRVANYCEVPSTYVALLVLERTNRL
ncbi:MAG: hypothetical protein K6T17_03755 [Fimbriimonadales bacterium]|nr:hypothetical protein [Fimbriimonadales bacterium]